MRRQSTRAHWENAYGLPLSDIPWEIKKPPAELVRLVESDRFLSGTALDVACGSGNYAVYLAQNGFDVLAVDFSEKALRLARQKVMAAGMDNRVHVIHADVRRLVSVLKGKRFDFILDWSLLHHVAPADFEAYVGQFSKLLAPGGVLLLSCFSDADAPQSGQKLATGKMGNVMYYRTRQQIESAYRPLKVLEYRECRLGKEKQHAGHCFLFQKPAAARPKR